ncbi:hypothetical protein BASA62_005528 [Batrachochytrium salamandrivorans]|nr:hypothetical protein BASA62_005528 [Batrachochytrium salamandrivorans]
MSNSNNNNNSECSQSSSSQHPIATHRPILPPQELPPLSSAILVDITMSTLPHEAPTSPNISCEKPVLRTYRASIPYWTMYIAAIATIYLIFLSLVDSSLSPSLGNAVQSTLEVTNRSAQILTSSSNVAALASLVIIVVMGILGGKVAERLKQAPMLGMLITGCLLRNVIPSLIVPIPHAWTTKLWTAALASVVARAGLSIDRTIITANLSTTLLIGIVPVAMEATVLATLVSFVFAMPAAWAWTLSFGVASISPGVVVPLLLNIAERPEWKSSRLPPLMLAALGVDVLVATTGFGVALASAMGHLHEHANDWIHYMWLTRAFEEIGGGLLCGTVIGIVAYLCMYGQMAERVAFWGVFSCSCLAMIWGKTHGFTGAASCSTILTWTVVANTWPRPAIDSADARLKLVWTAFKPFLFPVIGASVSFTEMPLAMFVKALLLVGISVLVKQIVCFIVSKYVGLSTAEARFWCGMWTGKASVQATLCGAALELVHHRGLEGSQQEIYARVVFCGMISAIVVGIPFASGWASSYGPGTLMPAPSGGSGLGLGLGLGVDMATRPMAALLSPLGKLERRSSDTLTEIP